MAVLMFNDRQLHVQVVAGVLETYKPNKEVKTLCKQIDKLKKETQKFIAKNWKETPEKEILELFKTDIKEKQKWDVYMKEKYIPQIVLIKEEVKKINGQLCPNYSEISK